jgi:hypothetical protein
MAKEIVLMRAGHYFDAGNGSCRGATIAHVFEDQNGTATAVNLAILEISGGAFSRSSVPVAPFPTINDTTSSFHLTRECPWER